MTERKSFSVSEFADRHGVCRSTVYAWIESEFLDSLKVGRVRRITREAEETFLNRAKGGLLAPRVAARQTADAAL